MLRSTRQIALAAAVLMSATVCAPSAWAFPTKAEAAAIWVARANAIANVADDPTTNGDNIFRRQKEACRGLMGESIQIGGQIPLWAAEGERSFCRAIDSFNGSGGVKQGCKDLKSAIGYLGKAKPFNDSEAVVPAAQRLVAVAEVMRAAAREAGFSRC